MTSPSHFTDGDAYEKLMGRWSRAAGDVFIDWLALPPKLNWVDVGCGTGAFTELVLERCGPAYICAIDPSEDQIAYAKSLPSAARVSYQVGDAQSLPYSNDEFDVAAMALVMVFVPNPTKAVAEMARVVKPGGTVATYMWDNLGGGFIQRPLTEALNEMNVPVSHHPGNPNSRLDAMNRFFEAAGLDQITTRKIDIEVSYANFNDYWTAQTGLSNPQVSAIRKMAASDVERLKATVRERLSAKDGSIAYPAWANAVKARVPA
jgi:ubiquinone/menaquinone biosynthesis C-methylase UbiE